MSFWKRNQTQEQVKIDKQEEAKTQLMKSQIDSMFEQFENIIVYLKTDNPKQQFLLTLNDSAVSVLKLLGSTCTEHVNKKEKNVLIAGYAHFNVKKQEMGADGKMIEHWINYAECALLGKKLKKLKISKITIEKAHKNMEQGGLTNFMDKYAGANHDTQDIVKDAETNRARYKLKNQTAIANTQQTYEQRQAAVQCPDQSKMYDVAGGAQNYQYGSSLYHPSSKYYNQRPRDDQENKEQSRGMDVDDSSSNKQYPWDNAYVLKAPSQTVRRDNKPVNIQYPYPCKIVKSFQNGKVLGVVYAKPNDDLRVKVEASNLERDTVKVSKLETEYMKFCNLTGDNPLGYESIIDQQFQ